MDFPSTSKPTNQQPLSNPPSSSRQPASGTVRGSNLPKSFTAPSPVTAKATNAAASVTAVSADPQSSSARQSARFGATSNSVVVNPRQRGNPVLQSIRSVPWEFGNVMPDYVMGFSSCALFLSLKYHNLNPEYIHDRLKALGRSYELQILLVLVDVKEPHHPLKELAKIAILSDVTLVPAWSPEEAGKYLELYKIYENKPADMIRAQVEGDYMSQLTEALTTVKSVNKTDAKTLSNHFRSLTAMVDASKDDLSLLPGFGMQKAKRLHDVLHQPFLKKRNAHPDNELSEI
ncbi:DNA excision repair protein ERCC-1-like [Paramacrobiotus metropolitanus]|uniref:DNA excision repair protein ERCC-1-like n=1 Tax=Paramacrobiotus metropolitanus TaxID=2943436 RepID=UPI002445D531|nr:DNA excision repair protein ERCC-1-like [Paramacrobiotus metropolitanus]